MPLTIEQVRAEANRIVRDAIAQLGALTKAAVLTDDPRLAASAQIPTIQADIAALESDKADRGEAPTAHAASHQNGGTDEINVAGLNGVLAEKQPAIPGGSDTQVQIHNNGTLDGATKLKYNTTLHQLRLNSTYNRAALVVQQNDAVNEDYGLSVFDNGGNAVFAAGSGGAVFLAPPSGTAMMIAAGGSCRIGDPEGNGNLTELKIDDVNELITANKDVEVTDANKGMIHTDRTTAVRRRFYIDNGVPYLETL